MSGLRHRRAFEKTRQCGESFFNGEVEVKSAEVFWSFLCSLKGSVDEVSDSLRRAAKRETKRPTAAVGGLCLGVDVT